MRHIFETAVILVGTLGFWGFVYPELCLTEDTYDISYDASEKEGLGDETEPYQDVYDFLNGSGEIRIKSKVVEYLYQVKEKADSKKD